MNDGAIIIELGRVIDAGWLMAFKASCGNHLIPLELALSVGSVESNLRNLSADLSSDGHGWGVMQIDDRSFSDALKRGTDAAWNIETGVALLAQNRDWLIRNTSQAVTVGPDSKGNVCTFIVPQISEPLFTRVWVAMYNAGTWAAYQVSQGRDPDHATTDGNYSASVMDCVPIFGRWLARLNKMAMAMSPGE